MENPTAFISYSHDDEEHKGWVLKLANRLISNGVNAILDQHDLSLGGDLPSYMENGLSNENRIICVCSERYTEKANKGQGGVGYEKMIMTGELLQNISTKWIIPIIRKNPESKVPKFLTGKFYGNFNDDDSFEHEYEKLLRELLNIPLHPKPQLGQSPFVKIKETGRIIFQPKSEKYHSPAYSGIVKFDYSNNNGSYSIGEGDLLFETKWSGASAKSIHAYTDSSSIDCLALVTKHENIEDIRNVDEFDYSSRVRTPAIGDIVIWQNRNGYFAATHIIDVKHMRRNADYDELTFKYAILTNATSDFSK